MEARDAIIALDVYYDHSWKKVLEAIQNKDKSILDIPNIGLVIDSKIYSILSDGYKVLCIVDEEYPPALLATPRPPFVIYYKCKLEDVVLRFQEIRYDPEKGCFLK